MNTEVTFSLTGPQLLRALARVLATWRLCRESALGDAA